MAKKKEEKKFLTEKHLDKIELLVQRQKIVDYELRELDYKLQLIRSTIEMAKLHIKVKETVIKDYQRVVPDYKAKIASIKDEEKEYMKQVKEDLGIKAERWGFDPDSGEIKEDSE